MIGSIRNGKGSALVTTLFFLLGLAVTGAIIAGVASSERRVTHNEYSHTRAVNASDAGSEVGISWIRTLNEIPLDPDGTKVFEVTTQTAIYATHVPNENNSYTYDITFDQPVQKLGWSQDIIFGQFTVDAQGTTTQDNTAEIEVQADRMFILQTGK
jgi:Tfp pilus assembly protein PilX